MEGQMEYQSTRSSIKASPAEAVLKGLAPDGGLFVYPYIRELDFDWRSCVGKDFRAQSAMILSALLPGLGDESDIVERSYRDKFENDDIAPAVKVGEMYVTELYHGPTSAFKDVALSVLPRLINCGKKTTGSSSETVILTATSGDTGKAALEGFSNVPGTKIIVFYPSEGVSAVQKAQMVTSSAENVAICAVEGNFDDCQTGVKKAFTSRPQDLLDGLGKELSSANSINIGRLVPQIAYYFSTYSQLISNGAIEPGDEIDFTVPTGNFGDILAGYYAKLLGLPIGTLVCASNSNSILTDFLNTGVYDTHREFLKTTSPSMDILVSSNLERLLFHACGNDPEHVSSLMASLSGTGRYEIGSAMLSAVNDTFRGYYASEEEVSDTIGRVWKDHHYLIDPHTAVAWCCAGKYLSERGSVRKMAVLSTASPFKFPAAVLNALGYDPDGDDFGLLDELSRITGQPIPKNLASLRTAPVIHKDTVSPDGISDYVISKLKNWSKR
ncbi:MAG: threonine synthase [Oscillospiraceae bacterium]|nr:threonine synthase [Oscillospiraceae bacterium]